MTGNNDENGDGMNQSIIESATREHVYTGFVDPRKCLQDFWTLGAYQFNFWPPKWSILTVKF